MHFIIVFILQINKAGIEQKYYQSSAEIEAGIYYQTFNVNKFIIIHRKGSHTPSIKKNIKEIFF